MSGDVRAAVDAVPVWYHTMDLPGGVTTPGWFDLRPVVAKMPWPDVQGKRCIDLGTFDGFLAFELERRGAREVVAIDVGEHDEIDWPVDARDDGPAAFAELAGPRKGAGFAIAKEALGSNVERVECNVYDVSPERVGTFDVAVCGSLLLHLRDPLRALEAIRSVCTGELLSAEPIDIELTVQHPRHAVTSLNGVGDLQHWAMTNLEGHRQLIRAGGFSIERGTKPYAIPFGPAHPPLPRDLGSRAHRALRTLVSRGRGVPHAAVLARPI